MLSHRKRCLTTSRGLESLPSVVFPIRPRRQDRLPMRRIVGVAFPSGRIGKTISVTT
ncbi:MAG: hypothetical protein HOJ67_18855 [Rhodospirillaceae bacterium]|nr:hypothetical protein [Rhodospirillales bacterium]MBT3907032.1 hypothetical protein [Rhodospirillaceae bacterium]MBT5036607.1 hypothetical protein [Rhodospirillaceae bacterium]MBT6221295.1 hypothetical protein [Rhodospirillaceae bacterium]MBT6364262.1 hypothetical protein [Rhodospirillaceae bacterium]